MNIFVDKEKTSLYEIHGIPELNEETTPSLSPSLGGSQHEDGQQYILDKYVDDRGRIIYKNNPWSYSNDKIKSFVIQLTLSIQTFFL